MGLKAPRPSGGGRRGLRSCACRLPGSGSLERLSGRERAARRGAWASATRSPASAVARESRRGQWRASLSERESRLSVPREAGAGGSDCQRGGRRRPPPPVGTALGAPAPRRHHRRHGSSEAEDSGPSCGPRAFPARGSHVASHVRWLLEPEPRGRHGPGEVGRACASRLRGLVPGTRRVGGGDGPGLKGEKPSSP